MGWCCGLFGSGSRRSSPGEMAAARPAQTGLEGVEFSPRHSFASSEGGRHRTGQNGLEGVEFSPSQSFASSDGEGVRPGTVMRPSKATQPCLPAAGHDTDPQNPELFGYYAPSSGLAQDSYGPQAPAPAPVLAGLPPYRSAYQ